MTHNTIRRLASYAYILVCSYLFFYGLRNVFGLMKVLPLIMALVMLFMIFIPIAGLPAYVSVWGHSAASEAAEEARSAAKGTFYFVAVLLVGIVCTWLTLIVQNILLFGVAWLAS